MEIRIIKLDSQVPAKEIGTSGTANIYRVIENGVEFKILFNSYIHGNSLHIEGKNGFLYTDRENDTVHRLVLAISEGCGMRTEADEIIEGLSSLSVQGVIYAERRKETREIIITDRRPGSTKGKPLVFIDDQKIELTDIK